MTAATSVSIAPLGTPEVRLDPYPYYARLHEAGPVCAVADAGSRYRFVVSGFDATAKLLRDPVFKVTDDTRSASIPTWDEQPTQAIFMNSVLFTNHPRHGRMRKMFNHEFTARRVAGLEPAMRQIIDDRLDHMAKAGAAGTPVDFMAEFAFPVPSNVMGELLGVPEQDRSWYRPRATALGVVLELGGGTPENTARADAASRELAAYFTELSGKRRDDPRDDLISALVAAMAEDPSALSASELIANLVVVFNAGFATTTHLIGNGLTLLLDHPDELKLLRERPDLAPAFVEEMLRLEVPTHFAIRWASADTEIAGVPVPEGSQVLILLAAANRDPARFEDPDRFDPYRPDPQGLSFGAGAHYCLGAATARMEGQLAFNKLFERFADIRLDREPGIPRQLMLRGHDELWVTVA